MEIARALDAPGVVLVDGDLPTRAARAALLAQAGAERECVLVEWRCSREEAEREVFHRYKSRPRILGSAELARYIEDAAVREAVTDEARGCTAVVSLGPERPLDEEVEHVLHAMRVVPAPPAPTATPRRRVMVVDDDPDERELLGDVLRELGWEVDEAPDAGVALVLLEGADIELLISDERMPGMSGIELTREVAVRHPEVRTVLLTAFSDEDMARRAVAANAVTVLTKPLSVIDLERVLEEAHA
jgi:CheY-like chemotaxis protein